MLIHLGADHRGFALKEHLKKFLKEKKYIIRDWGAKKLTKGDDYPDYAEKVGKAVQRSGVGILICGSSEGMCIAANKIDGIRAVAVWNTKNAKLTREDDDANILCLSGDQLTKKEAENITTTWLNTPFTKAKRHIRRINKIKRLE